MIFPWIELAAAVLMVVNAIATETSGARNQIILNLLPGVFALFLAIDAMKRLGWV